MISGILMILLGFAWLGLYSNQPDWLSIAFIILGSLTILHSIMGVILKIVKHLLEKRGERK